MRTATLLPVLSIALSGCAQLEVSLDAPATRQKAVTDSYHGTEVVDAYRWLEDWTDPEVRTWSDTQNVHARGALDALLSIAAIRVRVAEIMDMTPIRHGSPAWRGERLFALKQQPPLNQPFLVVMPASGDVSATRVLVDPNGIDPDGGTSIDWYRPSPDGSLVAVSLSVGGSESGDVHIFRTEDGVALADVIERVHGGTAGGDLAWAPDGTGFYYTRYPRDGERPAADLLFRQQLWYHQIGQPLSLDRYELGRGFHKTAEIEVDAEPGTGRVLATVQFGDSGRFALYVRELDGTWRQISEYGDGHIQAAFAPGGGLFVISRHEAPRGKVLFLADTAAPLDQAPVIVPEGEDVIVSAFYGAHTMAVTETRLYLTYQLGGPSEIRAFDHQGRPQTGPEVPPVSSVGESIVPLSGDDILFPRSSYVEPGAWYHFHAAEGTTVKTTLATEYPISFLDTEVVREYATSKDGTRVPINILRRRGTRLDGKNPVLVNGYGGFGVSRTPYFNPLRRIWLDHGGVYAYTNIRGGGEFGENWHRGGMLTDKQNCFDDFYACMQHMIDAGYTTSDKLAIEGGSNGGLLMGAMITQHPGLARAVVSHVGIYDMLRVELSTNGAFNIPEYGTVEDPEQFAALYAYSPYHRVQDGTRYPSVLFMTGANDPRVDPMHSRKMTARLQAATASGRPILLRTSSKTGHGLSAPLSERVEQSVDVLAFLLDELGMAFSADPVLP